MGEREPQLEVPEVFTRPPSTSGLPEEAHKRALEKATQAVEALKPKPLRMAHVMARAAVDAYLAEVVHPEAGRERE